MMLYNYSSMIIDLRYYLYLSILELEVKKKEEILTKQAIDVLREKERKYQELQR